MNWPFILTASMYGLLFAIWTAAVAIGTAEELPTQWGWIKIIAGGMASFVAGVFTYTRNPSGAWDQTPGGKP